MEGLKIKEAGQKKTSFISTGNGLVNFSTITKVKIPIRKLDPEKRELLVEGLERYLSYFGGHVLVFTSRHIKLQLPPFWNVYKIKQGLFKRADTYSIHDGRNIVRIEFDLIGGEIIIKPLLFYYIYFDHRAKCFYSEIYAGNTVIQRFHSKGLLEATTMLEPSLEMEKDHLELATLDWLNTNYPAWKDVFAYWEY